MRRPPAPVVAAVVIYALFAAVIMISSIGMAIAGAPALALLGLIGLLPGSVALGLWQGNGGARIVAIVFGFPLILLLAVPESSRAWFTTDELDEFVDEDGDDEDDEDDERAAGQR